MDKLFKGVRQFSEKEFLKNEALFHELRDKQEPHTLFIGCSDSRIVPHSITGALPGELFILRNVANIVPPYEVSNDHISALASIEYAVKVLKVENIVVCGHSDCGGCKALVGLGEQMDVITATAKWLEFAHEAYRKAVKTMKRDYVNEQYDIQTFETEVIKENVLLQVKHLYSYPFIKKRCKDQKLKIFGWYYNIGKGEVYNYNRILEHYEKI